MLDKPILLPIYPAREKPIEGVTSEFLLSKMLSEAVSADTLQAGVSTYLSGATLTAFQYAPVVGALLGVNSSGKKTTIEAIREAVEKKVKDDVCIQEDFHFERRYCSLSSSISSILPFAGRADPIKRRIEGLTLRFLASTSLALASSMSSMYFFRETFCLDASLDKTLKESGLMSISFLCDIAVDVSIYMLFAKIYII